MRFRPGAGHAETMSATTTQNRAETGAVVTGPTGNVTAAVAFRDPNADPSSVRGNIYGRYVAFCLSNGGQWHIQGQNRRESNETLCGTILTGDKRRLDINVGLIECPTCMALGGRDGFDFYPHIETPVGLSPQQRRLFESARDFGRYTDQGILVSGHAYRTALSLERKGLGTVRYQGPTMGWYSVIASPIPVAPTAPAPVGASR